MPRMARLFDLIAVLIVAVVVLLPQPSIQAYPAAQGDQADLDRLATLEDAHGQRPEDVQIAVELARAYLQVEQPAWALVALQPFQGSGRMEVHQVAAFAYATLLRPADALREAGAGCECDICAVALPLVTYLSEAIGIGQGVGRDKGFALDRRAADRDRAAGSIVGIDHSCRRRTAPALVCSRLVGVTGHDLD